MNRRTFLAALLASTALRTLPARSATKLVVPAIDENVAFRTFTLGYDITRVKALPEIQGLTLDALEELAAAIRHSFLPDPYRRYLAAASSWEAR